MRDRVTTDGLTTKQRAAALDLEDTDPATWAGTEWWVRETRVRAEIHETGTFTRTTAHGRT